MSSSQTCCSQMIIIIIIIRNEYVQQVVNIWLTMSWIRKRTSRNLHCQSICPAALHICGWSPVWWAHCPGPLLHSRSTGWHICNKMTSQLSLDSSTDTFTVKIVITQQSSLISTVSLLTAKVLRERFFVIMENRCLLYAGYSFKSQKLDAEGCAS